MRKKAFPKKVSNQKPLISVVVFSYNFEKYIDQCLVSIIKQTLKPSEIIVCDDCSSDKSWEIITKYKKRYPKLFRVFRHENNIGHIANGKFGKDQVTCDWTTVIDGDDYWHPEKLEMEWKVLQKNTRAKVAYSNVTIVDANGDIKDVWHKKGDPDPPSGEVFVAAFAKHFFKGRRSLFRNQLMDTAAMRKVGYGDPSISVHVDWDLKINMASKYPVVYSGAKTVFYRDHREGIHHKQNDNLYASALMVMRKNLHLLQERSIGEQKYVLSELNSLLVHLGALGKINPEQLNLNDINAPVQKDVPMEKQDRQKINPALKAQNNSVEKYLGENLIFLISQPRAGSTLLQRILAGNPKVHTVAEPWIMLHPLYALKEQGLQSEYSAVDAQIGLKDFMDNMPNGREDYLDGLRAMAHTWYGRALQNSGRELFLDKTPRYYHILPELMELLPQAGRVLLLRNPLAVLASILTTWIGRDWNRLGLHRNDLLLAPVLLADFMRKNPGAVSVVRYEELIETPEKAVSKLCMELGIDYRDGMLNYGGRPAPKGSMGDPLGVERHDRPSADSLEKWKKTFADPQYKLLAEVYLNTLGPGILAALGYEYNDLLGDLKTISTEPLTATDAEVDQMMQALKLPPNQLKALPALVESYRSKTPAFSVSSEKPAANSYRVSAVVSTYNSEKFIRGCLEGLVNQSLYTKGQLEIIVIDAHSPQNEKAIVEEFQKKQDHIRYVRTDQRETVYESWNRGIKMARAPYVTNANTDDRLRADALEKLAGLLDAHPDKALAYGDSLVTTVPNETFEDNSSDGSQDLVWPDFDRRTMHSWCYIGPHPVWRKSLHEELGYFDTSLKSAADWEFWLRVALKHDFIHLKEFIGLYYLSDETVSRRGNAPLIEAKQVRQKYKAAYKELPGEMILPPKMTITEAGKKNILVVVHNFPPYWFGGTENYVFNYVKALQQKGLTVHVLFPHLDEDQATPELRLRVYKGITTLQLWYDLNLYNDFLGAGGEILTQMFDELLTHNDFSYIHFQHIKNIPFDVGQIAAKHNIPYAVTLHDFTLMCFRNHFYIDEKSTLCSGPGKDKCASCFFDLYKQAPQGNQLQMVTEQMGMRAQSARELLKAAEKITAPSTFVKNSFVENGYISADRVEVHPLGLPALTPISNSGPHKKTVFGFLGTFGKLKNLATLLVAFKGSDMDAELEIWGKDMPQTENELHEFCKDDPRLRTMGVYQPADLPQILSRIDVLVVPSLTETYSMVVRESFMLKTPVIAGAVGGILDVVTDGENGWLFPPTDGGALLKIMQKIVKHPQDIAARAARIPEILTIAEDAAYWYDFFCEGPTAAPLKHKDKQSDKPRIGFLSADPVDRACPLIRLDAPLRRLHDAGWIDYQQLSAKDENGYTVNLENLDILILQRNMPGFYKYEGLKKYLDAFGVKLVYEFDDAFWTLPETHLAYNFYNQMRPQLDAYIQNADLVTVSTDYMARYCRDKNDNVRVLHNVIDEQLWPFKAPVQSGEKVRLLFAGTMTHQLDLRTIAKPLIKILNAYKDKVELVLWGNEIPELMELPNVVRGPQFTPVYPEYARQLQGMDIDLALVPLDDTPFNKAKSHIKWLEYAACGIPAVFSKLAAYPKFVQDKKTGLLVENTNKAWFRAIKWMIDNPQKRIQIAENAQKEVAEKYTLSKNLHQWRDAYFSLLDREAPREPVIAAQAAPEVALIIPVFNKLEYTQKCLKAVNEQSTGIDYEVIVVDNGSTDGTATWLKEQASKDKRIKVISNRQNSGFAVANNQAVKTTQAPYVLFLNNDTEPRAHWLDAMLAIVRSDDGVGAVGSKLLYPDMTIQHAGVAIVEDLKNGDPLLAQNILVGQPHDHPQTNLIISLQAVTAACLLAPRTAFEQVGGFDEGFWNGYEDVDLCFRLRKAGYDVVYQPHSEVIHHESKSGVERFKKVAENINRLHEKWLGKVPLDFRIETDGSATQLNGTPIKLYEPNSGDTRTEEDGRPLASIIMLTCNALEMTRKCVASVLAHTAYPFELIFVDNGSTDGTVDWLKTFSAQNDGVRAIYNSENRGFSAGNNQGVAKAGGDYICLLNNDVLVADGWLEDLIDAFDRDERIGMVGAVTNKASGMQILKNIPYTDDAGFYPFADNWRAQHQGEVTPRRRLAGFVMLTGRTVYEQVQGFDEGYGLGNFEDDDISLKIRAAGYALMVHDGTYIHHYGHSSFKANKIDLLESLKANEKIFRKKWPEVDYDELLEIKNPLHKVHPALIEQASRMLEQGEAAGAMELYKQVWNENPLSGEALVGMAFSCQAQGDLENAELYLQKAHLHFPDNPMVLNQLGVVKAQQGDPETALKYFEHTVKLDGSFLDAHHNLGQVLVETGRYEEGVKVFVACLSTNENDLVALVMMARFNLEAGRNEEAALYLEKARSIDPENPEVNEMLELCRGTENGTDRSSWQQKSDEGYELLNAFKEEAAEICFKESLNLQETPEALMGQALCAVRKEQQIRAITTLNKLIEKWPDFEVAYNQLGIIYFQNGELKNALGSFAKAIGLNPGYLEAQRNYGLSLVESGDYKNGIETFDHILGKHPDDIETLLIMANFYSEIERWAEAGKFADKVLSLDPVNSDALQLQERFKNYSGVEVI